MKKKTNALDLVREKVRREADEAWEKMFDTAALLSASSCLAQAKEITNPVEQVKYLFDRFKDGKPDFMATPWAWLAHCMGKGMIKEPPKEDWVICLFIHRAMFLGGPELVLQFLSKMN